MSTLQQMQEKKIERIRKPYWNERAYLELPSNGGLWLKLFDPRSQVPNGWDCPQNFMVFDADDGKDDWEEYAGELYSVEVSRGE